MLKRSTYTPIKDPSEADPLRADDHSRLRHKTVNIDGTHQQTRTLLIPVFILTIITVICVWIVALLDFLPSLVALLVIVVLTWSTAFAGMIGVYKWSSVEGLIGIFAQKNDELDGSIQVLQDNKSKVSDEAKFVHYTVDKLKKHGKDLAKHLHEFDQLRASLEQTVGQNQALAEMLDEVNKQTEDLRKFILENERAHLLSIFYKCSFRDGEDGLSQHEYERLLGRLNEKTRRDFELQGGFSAMDKDGSGTVDMREFADMVYAVLNL